MHILLLTSGAHVTVIDRRSNKENGVDSAKQLWLSYINRRCDENCPLLLACLIPVSAFAYKVIGVADGDTLTILVDKNPVKIRLANIDAPEKAQAFGERSKQSLSDLCFGKDATYQTQDIDRYGRTVAVVTCDHIEVNNSQVERGMAWVYPKYNKDGLLPRVQAQAMKDRRGLWQDTDPVPPWEFRKRRREN